MSKYTGAMPDSLFKLLNPSEEVVFRQWARNNYRRDCVPDNFAIMHPVVRDEWRKLDEAFDTENGILGWEKPSQ